MEEEVKTLPLTFRTSVDGGRDEESPTVETNSGRQLLQIMLGGAQGPGLWMWPDQGHCTAESLGRGPAVAPVHGTQVAATFQQP